MTWPVREVFKTHDAGDVNDAPRYSLMMRDEPLDGYIALMATLFYNSLIFGL